MIAVTSTWVKNDLMAQYGISPEKISVIPLAPVLGSYPTPTDDDVEATKVRLDLPDTFAFYPAQTWPHKNHLGLLRALRKILDRGGPKIPFVFSGNCDRFITRTSSHLLKAAGCKILSVSSDSFHQQSCRFYIGSLDAS